MEFNISKALRIITELQIYNNQKFSMEIGAIDKLESVKPVELISGDKPMNEYEIKKYVFLKFPNSSYEEIEGLFNTIKAICPKFAYDHDKDFTNEDIKKEIVKLNTLFEELHPHANV